MSEHHGTSGRLAILPAWIFESGAWARMKPGERAVLGVLALHGNKRGAARCGVRRIAQMAGMHTSSVSRSLHDLQDRHVITISHPRNGAPATYTVHPSANGQGDIALASGRTVEDTDRSPERNQPFAGAQQTVRSPVNETPLKGMEHHHREKDGDDEVFNLLRAESILPKSAWKIAAMPGITLEAAAKIIKKIKDGGGQPGAIVKAFDGIDFVAAAKPSNFGDLPRNTQDDWKRRAQEADPNLRAYPLGAEPVCIAAAALYRRENAARTPGHQPAHLGPRIDGEPFRAPAYAPANQQSVEAVA